MGSILQLLSGILGIASLVCAVLILIQLNKAKGPAHVALGIVSCCIYPLIWGWQNADQLDASNPPPIGGLKYKQIVQIWAGIFVAQIVLSVLSGVLG